MRLTDGMPTSGRISVGMLRTAKVPNREIRMARVPMVYGRLRAYSTIHMIRYPGVSRVEDDSWTSAGSQHVGQCVRLRHAVVLLDHAALIAHDDARGTPESLRYHQHLIGVENGLHLGGNGL